MAGEAQLLRPETEPVGVFPPGQVGEDRWSVETGPHGEYEGNFLTDGTRDEYACGAMRYGGSRTKLFLNVLLHVVTVVFVFLGCFGILNEPAFVITDLVKGWCLIAPITNVIAISLTIITTASFPLQLGWGLSNIVTLSLFILSWGTTLKVDTWLSTQTQVRNTDHDYQVSAAFYLQSVQLASILAMSIAGVTNMAELRSQFAVADDQRGKAGVLYPTPQSAYEAGRKVNNSARTVLGK